MKSLYAVSVFVVLALLCITDRIRSGTWVQKTMLAIDILLSTLLWGQYGVTISSRCGLYLRKGEGPVLWRGLGHALNAISKGHCETAIANDKARAEAALTLLNS